MCKVYIDLVCACLPAEAATHIGCTRRHAGCVPCTPGRTRHILLRVFESRSKKLARRVCKVYTTVLFGVLPAKIPNTPGVYTALSGCAGCTGGCTQVCEHTLACACVKVPRSRVHTLNTHLPRNAKTAAAAQSADMSRATPKPRSKAATMCARTVRSGCAKNRGTERAFDTPDVHTNVHTTLIIEEKSSEFLGSELDFWSRGQDLNLRPSGYEPDELPDCSTPHCVHLACARNNYTHCPSRSQGKISNVDASPHSRPGRTTLRRGRTS